MKKKRPMQHKGFVKKFKISETYKKEKPGDCFSKISNKAIVK